jgi:hypothetical protein
MAKKEKKSMMDNDTHIRQKHINKVVIVMPAQGSTPGTT